MTRISCKRGDTVGDAAKEICKMIERAYGKDSDIPYFINEHFNTSVDDE